MSNTTSERDILGDILNDSHNGSVRGLDELSKLIHVTSRADDPLTGFKGPKKGNVSPRKKKKKQSKRKSTHYLNEEVFDNLGEAKKIISEYLPTGSKRMATKSRIVESAIKVLLTEFDENGEDSYLVKELLKKNTKEKK